jgi:molybdate transport system regulatory protein
VNDQCFIEALLTKEQLTALGFKKGQTCTALIKASDVMLATETAGLQLATPNQLSGTVSRLQKGAVNALVSIGLPGGLMLSAAVTNEAAIELGLKPKLAVTAVFGASAVLLATGPSQGPVTVVETAATKSIGQAVRKSRSTTKTA